MEFTAYGNEETNPINIYIYACVYPSPNKRKIGFPKNKNIKKPTIKIPKVLTKVKRRFFFIFFLCFIVSIMKEVPIDKETAKNTLMNNQPIEK